MSNDHSLKHNSPRYLAMKAVIESDAGISAMEEAAAKGNPALCGVDALLTGIIIDYKDHQTLMAAGRIVAGCMRAREYTQGPEKDCPSGCTAGRGAMWLPPA